MHSERIFCPCHGQKNLKFPSEVAIWWRLKMCFLEVVHTLLESCHRVGNFFCIVMQAIWCLKFWNMTKFGDNLPRDLRSWCLRCSSLAFVNVGDTFSFRRFRVLSLFCWQRCNNVLRHRFKNSIYSTERRTTHFIRFTSASHFNKKLSYRRRTARRAVWAEILSTPARQHETSHLKMLAISEWNWGHSRSSEFPLFDRPYIISYQLSVVTTIPR